MKHSKDELKQLGLYLSDSDYEKAIGQLKLQVLNVLSAFNKYGHQEFIPAAANEIIKLAEDFALRCRGVDKPISLELIRKKGK